MRKAVFIAAAGAAGVALYWLAKGSRAFVEKASYHLKQKDGDFELRDYPDLTLATAPMRQGERSKAFNKLFGFITGRNDRGERIPMTAPVLIQTAGAQSAMSFVIPAGLLAQNPPQPEDESVTVARRPAERVAAYRFYGRATDANERLAVGKLRDWLRRQGLNPTGEPIVAYYDAPWIPPLLRRNEVMLRVAD
jgi:hypothetical protein